VNDAVSHNSILKSSVKSVQGTCNTVNSIDHSLILDINQAYKVK